jgi:hypothetical protein
MTVEEKIDTTIPINSSPSNIFCINRTCPSDGDENEIHTTTTYRLYRRRWLVLASFSLLSMNSAWIWITFSPIAVSMAEYWNVSLEQVDAIAAIYLYVYVPCSFLSLYLVVNHLGLWKGLLVGGICNLTTPLSTLVHCWPPTRKRLLSAHHP